MRRAPALLLAITALAALLAPGCQQTTGACEDGRTRCASLTLIQQCVQGDWRDHEVCTAEGETCRRVGLVFTCAAAADSDADTDSDIDSDTDTDGDTDTDTDTEPDTTTLTDLSCDADTCTDPATQLVWQRAAPEDSHTWDSAAAYCAGLDLAGAIDWRLPLLSELRTLVRGCAPTFTGGTCKATEGCLDVACGTGGCIGCSYLQGPGDGGCYWPVDSFSGDCQPHPFWSAGERPGGGTAGAWYVDYRSAGVRDNAKAALGFARCVRGP